MNKYIPSMFSHMKIKAYHGDKVYGWTTGSRFDIHNFPNFDF